MRTVNDMSPPPSGPSSGPKRWQIVLAIAIGLIGLIALGFRSAAVFYTDLLWFQSVDLGSVWSSLLFSKLALGAVGAAVFATVIYLNLLFVDRNVPAFVSFSQEDELARQFRKFADKHRGLLRFLAALALGVLGGSGFSAHWNEWMLFMNGGSFGATDAQFNKDIGFFVFKLPFLTILVQWIFVAIAFGLIVSLVAHYLNGAIRPQLPRNRVTNAAKAHVTVLFGLLALARAAQYWLERYNLSYSTRGPEIVGANYTDVKVLMPALVLLTLISVVAAIALFVGARTRSWTWPIATVGSWLIVSLLAGSAIPAAVQRFSVAPAESEKEKPFIQRNVDATRAALNLTDVEVKDFNYSEDLTAAALENNTQTVRNVRLWDTDLVKPSYRRLQESRSYFQFSDIDIDRYDIAGQTTQMMLSVRELNAAGLPQERRSWVNQHLAFTHGYGAVASPANAVTANGEPSFTVKDFPPLGTPEITTPQVYFGEDTNSYSIVNTKQGEVDYTAPDGRDQTSNYKGTGGVELSNPFKRAAFAARVGAIEPLISDLVTPQSRAMYLTDIRDRMRKAAPFLRYDNDPYAVIDGGRIKWVQDAYTTTAYYPYGQTADTSLVADEAGGLATQRFNYVRNSVKVITDAYDGTMTYYIADDQDPIIKAWAKAFPDLFTSNELPEGLRNHVRYPEDLFRTQSTMFGSYHLTDAGDFYSKSDRWNIAQRPGTDVGNTNTTLAPVVTAPTRVSNPSAERRIEPSYLLMKLPGETEESFLMLQPFVPYSQNDSRKELSAFMVAKSDPDQYGQIQAHVMPRGQQIDGPELVEARIQSNPEISQYITLLSRAGSTVALGDMLVIPIDNSLLYVRPLYVQAQSTQVPEFKKAIVVQGDNIAMEDTLQASLTKIFGAAPATLEAGPVDPDAPVAQPSDPSAPASPTLPSGPVSPQAAALLDQANAEFAAADAALRNGNLAEYQARVQAGIALVRQARGI